MGDFLADSIRERLATAFLGNKVEVHRQVGSTNDLVREAGRSGAAEGLVILAEEQVKGRGRLGRIWTAPVGSSILCSVLLRPRFSPQQAFYLTIATSLAILRAISNQNAETASQMMVGRISRIASASASSVPHISIKWPNDVLVNGRKSAGVLSEGEFRGGDWAFAVVGFGINVNLGSVALEGLRMVAPRATSLSAEMGVEVDRAELLARVLEELEGLYLLLQNGQFRAVFSEWVNKLETIGRRVLVEQGSERIRGVALRVDGDGALVVRGDNGEERRVLAGDVI